MSHSMQPETRQNPARFAPLEPARQIGVAARRSPTPRDKSSVGAHADVFESAAAVKSSSGPPRFGGATAAPLAEPASSGVQLASSGRLREHKNHTGTQPSRRPLLATKDKPPREGLDVGLAVNPQIAYIRAYTYALRAGLSRTEAEALASEVRELHRQQHASLFNLTVSLSGLLPGVGEGIDAVEFFRSIRNGDLLGSALAAAGLLLPFIGSKAIKSMVGVDGADAGRRAALGESVTSLPASSRIADFGRLSQQIEKKIPGAWGPPIPNKKGIGMRWFGPKGDSIRIDKGVPSSPFPSQRVDHVVINRGGRPIGPDGSPIPGPLKDHPEAHIPLSQWLEWKSWFAP
ncbi:MAG: hypothetical protein AAGJ56_10815 [Myxococcota bacterium]